MCLAIKALTLATLPWVFYTQPSALPNTAAALPRLVKAANIYLVLSLRLSMNRSEHPLKYFDQYCIFRAER